MTYDVIDRARRATLRRITAGCLAAATAVVTVVAVVQFTGHRSATDGPTAGAAPAQTGTSPGPSKGAGDLAAALPDDLDWVDVAGVSLPVSARCGPHDTAAGLARGFNHDRAGAVLAAVHIIARLAPQVGPAVFEPTLREQVVGPDTAAMREQVARDYDTLRRQAQLPYGQPIGPLAATLRGYRLTAYSPDEAAVAVLTQSADGHARVLLVAADVRMSWTRSDWALRAPPGGSFDPVVSAVTAEQADAYHPFHPGR